MFFTGWDLLRSLEAGIMRIRQLYEKSLRKPEFEVSENAIQIVLPVWESNLDLTEDEKMIYGILSKNRLKSMGGNCTICFIWKIKNDKAFERDGGKRDHNCGR